MTCSTCKANKVCDHNKHGFENCNNYIPEKADFAKIPCRCGECKYAIKHYEIDNLINGWMRIEGEYRLLYITCENSRREKLAENDFCSYGEKRDA